VEILRVLRANVSEALGPLDDRIVSDFPWRDDPRENLMTYLSHLGEIVGAGTQEEASRALGLIRRYVTTENRQPISEIRVDLSPGEREQYGVEAVRLQGAPELDVLRSELRALRTAILEDNGNTPGRQR